MAHKWLDDLKFAPQCRHRPCPLVVGSGRQLSFDLTLCADQSDSRRPFDDASLVDHIMDRIHALDLIERDEGLFLRAVETKCKAIADHVCVRHRKRLVIICFILTLKEIVEVPTMTVRYVWSEIIPLSIAMNVTRRQLCRLEQFYCGILNGQTPPHRACRSDRCRGGGVDGPWSL